MAELIKMPFGMWTQVGTRKHALVGVQIPTHEGQFWGQKRAGPEHARTCVVVDILKVTQQGAETV